LAIDRDIDQRQALPEMPGKRSWLRGIAGRRCIRGGVRPRRHGITGEPGDVLVQDRDFDIRRHEGIEA
jgi:hypothetical protein